MKKINNISLSQLLIMNKDNEIIYEILLDDGYGELITEEQGVSKEVQEAADFYLPKIQELFVPNIEERTFEIDDANRDFTTYNLICREKLFGIVSKIICHIYNFKDFEEFTKLCNTMLHHNYFDLNNYNIEVTLVSINKNVINKYSYETICHEFLHAYQESKLNTPSNSILYNTAKHIYDNTKFGDSLNSLATLILWFHNKEINANMQPFYKQLKMNGIKEPNVHKQTRVYQEYMQLLEYHYNNAFTNYSPYYTANVKHYFKMAIQKLQKYIDNQKKVLFRKIRQIEDYYLTECRNIEIINEINSHNHHWLGKFIL